MARESTFPLSKAKVVAPPVPETVSFASMEQRFDQVGSSAPSHFRASSLRCCSAALATSPATRREEAVTMKLSERKVGLLFSSGAVGGEKVGVGSARAAVGGGNPDSAATAR